jgi:hypothetical protein
MSLSCYFGPPELTEKVAQTSFCADFGIRKVRVKHSAQTEVCATFSEE